MERTFAAFMEEVRGSLEEHAERKGYNRTGADGPNELFEDGIESGDEPAHAVGEIRYKLREFLHDPRPVLAVKAAAWSFLLWRYCAEFPVRETEQISRCVR